MRWLDIPGILGAGWAGRMKRRRRQRTMGRRWKRRKKRRARQTMVATSGKNVQLPQWRAHALPRVRDFQRWHFLLPEKIWGWGKERLFR